MWKYVEDLYLHNSGKITAAPGVSLVPKLKYEHIYLTSYSKMRVDLAAQVINFADIWLFNINLNAGHE